MSGPVWRSAAACSWGNCVEVSFWPDGAVWVRNSRFPDDPAQMFDRDEWTTFLTAVRAGEFDPPTDSTESA